MPAIQRKNKPGRPLRFKNPKALQDKIDAYFQDVKDGNQTCTIMGLCLWLDVDRTVFWRYAQGQDEEVRTSLLCNICARARDRVMRYYESMPVEIDPRLAKHGDAMLSRMGWVPEQAGVPEGQSLIIMFNGSAQDYLEPSQAKHIESTQQDTLDSESQDTDENGT